MGIKKAEKSSLKLRRKRSISLLEVIIAFGLTALVVSFLFGFYRQLLKSQQPLEKDRQEAHSSIIVQLRLAKLFSEINADQLLKGNLPFFTDEIEGSKALILYHDNGIDKEPGFCGSIPSALYIQGGQLCLMSWSIDEEGRKEVFFEGINNLKFYFFSKSKKKWVEKWPEPLEKDPFPSMVKIILEEKSKKNLVFSFFLNDGEEF